MGKNNKKQAPVIINWKKLLLPLIGFIIGVIVFLWIAKKVFLN